MKKILSLFLIVILSVNHICTSYASIFDFFDFFKKNETVQEFPKRDEGKYLNYINLAIDKVNDNLKKNNYDLNSVVIDYENVIWENELKKDDIFALKDDKPIAQYLVCILCHGIKKEKKEEVESKENYLYLCQIPYGEYKNAISEQLVEVSELDLANSELLSDILEGGSSTVGAGAAAGAVLGGAIGSIIPGAGTAAGTALGGGIGSLVGFLGGAGSKVFGKWKKDKKLLNDLVKELPEDVYYDTLVSASAFAKVKIDLINQNEISKYLSDSDINILNEMLKD